MSITSCTSPKASRNTLPISLVTKRESASLFFSNNRPAFAITRPRAGAGIFAHATCAAFARRAASTMSDAVAAGTSATTSDRLAGFRETKVDNFGLFQNARVFTCLSLSPKIHKL